MSRNNLNLLRKCKGARSKDTRVRAPNEPRIIVARPSATHPSLIAERSFRYLRTRSRRAVAPIPADSSFRASTRVYSEASARRYADLLRREIIGERCVADHASRGTWITNVRSWKDREEAPRTRVSCNIWNNFSDAKDRANSISR